MLMIENTARSPSTATIAMSWHLRFDSRSTARLDARRLTRPEYLRNEGDATAAPNEPGPIERHLPKNAVISENDARVLAILQTDGRRSYAELGADLGMAGPSAHERVKKLESRGVIRGYSAELEAAAVG